MDLIAHREACRCREGHPVAGGPFDELIAVFARLHPEQGVGVGSQAIERRRNRHGPMLSKLSCVAGTRPWHIADADSRAVRMADLDSYLAAVQTRRGSSVQRYVTTNHHHSVA